MQTQNNSARPSQIRALRPVAAAPLRGQEAVLATLAVLQRELDNIQQQLNAQPPAPPVKVSRETEQQELLLSFLRQAPASGLWLTELQALSGLSKNVTHTRAGQLAYARRVDYSKEPGPTGKLSVRLRLPENVAKEF